ncbi:ABC transporter permease [Facklamia lactis]|uniref:ABC transporter permease n=1 Tax=Facklamia lactis TaxID=2749967 RepID=UPI0018CFC5B7|nr:ABC transporter permease [Facklamia lactis]MBG9981049.1 ABC transporter permease [Facklamia lactis]
MRYWLYKFFSTMLTLLLVSLIIFLIFNVLPGNPAQAILGIDADPQEIRNLELKLGLDQPLLDRYFSWIGGLFRGDLGLSYRYREPVGTIIAERFPVTLSLALFSFFITLVLAIPLGLFISRYEGKFISTFVNMISQLGISVPSFWLAFILLYIFSVKLGLLPTFGYVDWRDNFLDSLKSLFLPSLSIAIGNISVIIRYLSNAVSEQLSLDYVTTAKVKGLNDQQILYQHVLKNSSLSVITVFGLMVADTLGGSIIIENVFALPGIGSLLNSSVQSRDFPLIQSLVMVTSLLIIVSNVVVDLVYQIVDPRIRLGRK